MLALVCPVCGGVLQNLKTVFRCPSGHSFDISKEGYVNLLIRRQTAKSHGDDGEMVRARRDFLSLGFYDPLSREVCMLAAKYRPRPRGIIDCGCGEGSWLDRVLRFFEGAGVRCDAGAADISKRAAAYAARRLGDVPVAVASASALPFADGCADIVLSMFAPFFAAEFCRVLAQDGVVLRAYPLKNHLIELKRLVYDDPVPNPDADMAEPGLEIAETKELEYPFSLERQQDVRNLFMMTPYAHKTGESDIKKLDGVSGLAVTAHFGLAVYKKRRRAGAGKAQGPENPL